MPKRKKFWDSEYSRPAHLALSDEPSEDLIKFSKWLVREYGKKFLNVTTLVADAGCGNGRNLLYLAREYGVHGVGYDTSKVALMQARSHTAAQELPLVFEQRSIAKPIPLADSSATIVLDMMSSHVLKRVERETLRSEILRILKSEGWLFFKSFLLDDDKHAARLLRERPGPEEGTYLHPSIGVAEYVWTESSLREFYEPYFTIHHLEKSFKHKHIDGSPWKRRTISAYLEKT